MAGIGFELKKLFNTRSTFGYFRACFYTAVVTIGPYVLATTMILTIQALMKSMDVDYHTRQLFLASIVYPFIFSQIVSSGFVMLITRFIADKLYCEQFEEILPSLYGIIAVVLLIAAVPVFIFYYCSPLDLYLKIASYLLYMELIVMWLQGVYLSALKDYMSIVKAYAAGSVAAVILAYIALWLNVANTALNIILAVDIGIFLIVVLLMKNIDRIFRTTSQTHFALLEYVDNCFSLFLINFFYTLGIYLPNIIIWFSPLQVKIADTYLFAPIYDVATFYAFLSILPAMLMFVVSTELKFYDKYKAYFMYITGKGNYKEINDARQDMLRVMWSEITNIIEFQMVVSLFALAMGNYLLPKIGITQETLDIFDVLLFAAYSTGIMQIIVIILLYFDDKYGALMTTGFFLIANAVCNLVSLVIGEHTYGFGTFIACFLSLLLALSRLYYYTNRIDYYIFCSQPVFNNRRPGFLTQMMSKSKGELGKRD
ncbi:MAG: exopolysaccharide Pel transporter PelG [Sporomusaceae bacterium]|nr:exopolysaccharide Pel transporter PelG [Sporomusaceae bacterium]